MFIQTSTDALKNEFNIHTQYGHWVIPHNCELLKALLQQQKLRACDLQFTGTTQCKSFLKNLFLLAVEDETSTQSPSILAQFGRDIIHLQNQQYFY